MKLRYYTDEEIASLKSNMFVKNVLHKRTIEYDVVFKLWCIMMRFQFPEYTGKDIFSRAGFDINILNDSLPQKRIGEWVKNYKKFGIKYFLPEMEHYHSLKKDSKVNEIDYVKIKLLNAVLKYLKNYKED